MGRATFPLLILITVALFIATHNTVSMVFKHRGEMSDQKAMSDMDGNPAGGVDTYDPLIKMPRSFKNSKKKKKRMFHTVMTASSVPYNNWQSRVMYYWYKQQKEKAGSEMGGFTRLLHTGKADHLMDEIPTYVVQPLPEGTDKGFVVLNRPWAFVQWFRDVEIEEDYVFMAEPDHIIIRPIPNLSTGELPAAFPFFYIDPKQFQKTLRRWYPESKGPITNIDPIGNSPVIIKKSLLKEIAPTWMNVSLEMKNDPQADKDFGWVLEMYGYAVASAMHGVQHVLRKDFMLQPPYDTKLEKKFIIHYTYGCDYTLKGEPMFGKFGEWRFDKRSYGQGAPPRNLTMPPKGVHESVVTLVRMINEATANIPNWKEGER
ncbi:hypothetical protein SELMODRAFT_150302 [Selaginella moellendorffii]|uniref:Hydroxyproline O-arabinosyltransferase-like domain-containing protein n=1 Tax=Selaginella moellendorffii TaxID=88036 RepID=D8RVG8_SELML|nr:hydroxyproline O-arabinosyltransferase 3 [Selaginella moellendorffii]EFJ23955.1 hypothetical protein SELMODRAFT_150302 [Selaginella moellendorffii]|eukprot:XP_002975170.1 hydroxyproline O-arabinosyltransferase 3 [Selaginella moellendorffii]